MLILEPTLGEKTITIAPRKKYQNLLKERVLSDNGVFETSDCLVSFTKDIGYSLRIRRDGDGKQEILNDLEITNTSNYTQVKFEPTILEEDSTYYMEITKDSELWYRDKIYVTSQNATERLTNKHEIGNGTLYKTYNPVDDNTYII
tara:strand:- start:804 stop:1241 length:438 start_codon:yes stop_codon:yes gene_type:complete